MGREEQESWPGEGCWSPSHPYPHVQRAVSIIIFSVWVKAIAFICSQLFCCPRQWMDCVGFASCKASSSILLLVQSAQGDLILQGQRQIIRACIIFLLCVGRAVKPSLRGINWLCEGCCRHLQIVPEGVSAVCSLCTTVSILLPTQLLMSNKPSQT